MGNCGSTDVESITNVSVEHSDEDDDSPRNAGLDAQEGATSSLDNCRAESGDDDENAPCAVNSTTNTDRKSPKLSLHKPAPLSTMSFLHSVAPRISDMIGLPPAAPFTHSPQDTTHPASSPHCATPRRRRGTTAAISSSLSNSSADSKVLNHCRSNATPASALASSSCRSVDYSTPHRSLQHDDECREPADVLPLPSPPVVRPSDRMLEFAPCCSLSRISAVNGGKISSVSFSTSVIVFQDDPKVPHSTPVDNCTDPVILQEAQRIPSIQVLMNDLAVALMELSVSSSLSDEFDKRELCADREDLFHDDWSSSPIEEHSQQQTRENCFECLEDDNDEYGVDMMHYADDAFGPAEPVDRSQVNSSDTPSEADTHNVMLLSRGSSNNPMVPPSLSGDDIVHGGHTTVESAEDGPGEISPCTSIFPQLRSSDQRRQRRDDSPTAFVTCDDSYHSTQSASWQTSAVFEVEPLLRSGSMYHEQFAKSLGRR